MRAFIVPKGTAMYVTTSESQPGVNMVPGPFPDEKLLGYVRGVFKSKYEVQFTINEVVDHWQDSVRIFKLPPNEFGEYLVVIQENGNVRIKEIEI